MQGNVVGAPRTPPTVHVYELDDILGGSLFIDKKNQLGLPPKLFGMLVTLLMHIA